MFRHLKFWHSIKLHELSKNLFFLHTLHKEKCCSRSSMSFDINEIKTSDVSALAEIKHF